MRWTQARRGKWFVASVVALAATAAVTTLGVLAWKAAVEPGESEVSQEELDALPPVVFIWAERQRAKGTASGDLYAVDPGESSARELRTFPGLGSAADGVPYGVFDASRSPDGKRIALLLSVWNSDPDGQVALVDATGRRVRLLGRSSWTAGHARWSPSGRELAYTVLGRVLIHSPAPGTTRLVWRARGHRTIAGIAWSPDGRRLVVAEERKGLVAMSSIGTDVRRLTHGPDTTPEFAPDGERIVFTRDGTSPSLWLVGLDGRAPQRLTEGHSPAWSPNGAAILFARTRTITDEYGDESYLVDAYVVGGRGDELTRLTDDGASWPVAWSADGTKILFLRERRDDEAPDKPWQELWLMDADGDRPTRLPFNQDGWSVLSADWRG